MSDTLSLAETAARLHLGIAATRALFDNGELPGVAWNQKRLVFRVASVDAYLHAVEARQTAERKRTAEVTAARKAQARTIRPALPDLSRYERDGLTTTA